MWIFDLIGLAIAASWAPEWPRLLVVAGIVALIRIWISARRMRHNALEACAAGVDCVRLTTTRGLLAWSLMMLIPLVLFYQLVSIGVWWIAH
jgi:hypothetical protein